MRSVLSILMAFGILSCAPAFAGFQGFNGNTNLNIFNKLQCSTGTTCTKVGDKFVIVSSPTISTGAFTVKAALATGATLDLQADNNGSNGDDWQLISKTSAGGFALQNNTSGSQVQKWGVDTSGNMSVVGTATVAGKTILTGGIGSGTSLFTRFAAWVPSAVADATSTTPVATTVYLTQMRVSHNFTATGIQVLNAATVGTNKYIVAMYNEAGTLVANSATAGVLTAGASAFQSVPFTATAAIVGPATYWIAVWVNGTTDRFYAIPAVGSALGLAGTITGQTFGTIPSTLTLPTTFTAASGAVVATY